VSDQITGLEDTVCASCGAVKSNNPDVRIAYGRLLEENVALRRQIEELKINVVQLMQPRITEAM
jgi:mitochondrial fission protein ELM1